MKSSAVSPITKGTASDFGIMVSSSNSISAATNDVGFNAPLPYSFSETNLPSSVCVSNSVPFSLIPAAPSMSNPTPPILRAVPCKIAEGIFANTVAGS